MVAAVEDKFQQDSPDKFNNGIALAQLVAYINQVRDFKLADLVQLYSIRLEQLGVKQHDHTQSTHLKNCILSQFPELPTRKEECCNALLFFDKDLRPALLDNFERDYADEGICLEKAANIVFRDMLILEAPFTGSFDLDC